MVTLRIHLSSTVEIEVSGDDHRQAIEQAAFWTNLPTECPVCGSPLVLFYRTPQQYEFYGLRCTGSVAHESTFGIHKADGSLFYKEREAWVEARIGRQTDEDGWPEADDAAYGDTLPPPPPEPQRPAPARQQRGNGGNGRQQLQTVSPPAAPQQAATASPVCADCGKPLTLGQINYSTAKFGRPLCPAHQN